MNHIEELLAALCPDGVEFRTIGDICDHVSAGGDLPENYQKGQISPSTEFPFPIYSNGSDERALYGYTDSYRVDGDAVTISARGTIGYHAVRKGKFTPIVRLITLIPNNNLISAEFLNYALDITEIGHSGGSIPQLTVPNVTKIRVPVPPVEVQREIVRVLDTFTALEAELEAELEARRRQYAYYRDRLLAFNGRADIRWATLREVALEFGRGKSKHRPRNDPRLYGGDIPFIQTGDIRNAPHVITKYSQTYSEFGLAQSKLWPKGTLCITIAANIAETTILGFDSCFPDSVIGFVANPQKANVHFVEYLLTSFKTKLQAQSTGSAQDNLNLATLENERLPFPSIEEQARIVAILDKFDALVNDLTSGLPAEINGRRQQYAHYRNRLLTFPEAER